MKQKQEKLSTTRKIWHIFIVLIFVCAFFAAGYAFLLVSGLWEYVNSPEKIKNFILNLGFYGRGVYLLLQFLQVTFLPIPSSILVIAGSLVYGAMQASLLSLAGILLGSALAFTLGKTQGKRLVVFMVGEETCRKWVKFLSGGKYSYCIMMLLPFFPDDVLCLVAGLTDMTPNFFMLTQFITRPIGIITTAYFSSGEIIPYHGWGLVVWGIIVILAIILIVLSIKYQSQIEKFCNRFFRRAKPLE